jgi:toxin ParE1/3/4
VSGYRLTPAAAADLADIVRYTRAKWGKQQADRYALAIKATCEALAQDPAKGRDCGHIRAGYRSARSSSHVLYFKAAPYGVAVIRILHERMDAPRHL